MAARQFLAYPGSAGKWMPSQPGLGPAKVAPVAMVRMSSASRTSFGPAASPGVVRSGLGQFAQGCWLGPGEWRIAQGVLRLHPRYHRPLDPPPQLMARTPAAAAPVMTAGSAAASFCFAALATSPAAKAPSRTGNRAWSRSLGVRCEAFPARPRPGRRGSVPG